METCKHSINIKVRLSLDPGSALSAQLSAIKPSRIPTKFLLCNSQSSQDHSTHTHIHSLFYTSCWSCFIWPFGLLSCQSDTPVVPVCRITCLPACYTSLCGNLILGFPSAKPPTWISLPHLNPNLQPAKPPSHHSCCCFQIKILFVQPHLLVWCLHLHSASSPDGQGPACCSE